MSQGAPSLADTVFSSCSGVGKSLSSRSLSLLNKLLTSAQSGKDPNILQVQHVSRKIGMSVEEIRQWIQIRIHSDNDTGSTLLQSIEEGNVTTPAENLPLNSDNLARLSTVSVSSERGGEVDVPRGVPSPPPLPLRSPTPPPTSLPITYPEDVSHSEPASAAECETQGLRLENSPRESTILSMPTAAENWGCFNDISTPFWNQLITRLYKGTSQPKSKGRSGVFRPDLNSSRGEQLRVWQEKVHELAEQATRKRKREEEKTLNGQSHRVQREMKSLEMPPGWKYKD